MTTLEDFGHPGPRRFQARFWIGKERQLQQIETWSHFLDPMESCRRSLADWALEYLQEVSDEDQLEEWFQLDPTKNWQVLLEGTLVGTSHTTPDGDEHDTEFDILSWESAPVSDDFFDAMFAGPPQPSLELINRIEAAAIEEWERFNEGDLVISRTGVVTHTGGAVHNPSGCDFLASAAGWWIQAQILVPKDKVYTEQELQLLDAPSEIPPEEHPDL